MALLLLMERWARENDARLSAVTLDHGLRPEAAGEAAMVAAFCAGRGIPHDTLKWRGWDGAGNVQAAAREARYRLIAEWAQAKGVEAVCLGHTRDDQAETFLMRLARKAGSDGLRGMERDFERNGARWVRPVLSLERTALRGFLERQGVGWVDDPSNADESFDRVKARKALECLAPLGIDAAVLGAVAHNLQMENSLLREATRDALAGKVEERFGALSMERRAFRLLHVEVQRRFLTAAVQWISGAGYPPRAMAEFELGHALEQGQTHTLGGVIGFTSKGRIWLAREPNAARGMSGDIFDGRWRIAGDLAGREIRAVGEDGLRQRPDWREMGLPRRVLLSLPALWEGENLAAVPALGEENSAKATLIRPTFDKWLRQH